MYLYNCVGMYSMYIVVFTVLKAQDENNKLVTGVFTWTALSRKNKLTVLRELPPMDGRNPARE